MAEVFRFWTVGEIVHHLHPHDIELFVKDFRKLLIEVINGRRDGTLDDKLVSEMTSYLEWDENCQRMYYRRGVRKLGGD